MNQVPLLFLGVFAALATSFYGLILTPHLTIGQMKQTLIEETGQYYPTARNGIAQGGADVYRSLGCAECHSQQVQGIGLGPDSARGWGRRRTIAEDYLLDDPVQLGVSRLGPDLSNIGLRNPSQSYHLQHLYNPKLKVPGSIMPQYKFLFTERALAKGEKPSPKALPLDTKPGYEVLPSEEAVKLVAYLESLKADSTPLYSAPFPVAKTNAPAAPKVAPAK